MSLIKAGSNSLFSNSFFIFITRFFPSLANLVVLILYSRELPQDVYGNYQYFWIQLYIIYPLACFGIHVVAVTYAPGFILSLLKRIRPAQYGLYALWGVVLAAVFALLQRHLPGIPFLVPFFFLISFSVSVILESFLIVTRSYSSLILINLLYSTAFCGIHWFVLQRGFSLEAIFSYLLIVTVLRMVIYLLISVINFRSIQPEETQHGFDVKTIRSLWLHLGLYDVLQVLFSWIDKFIISLVLSAALSAIYFNGSQNIPFLPMLLGAAGSAVLIQLAGGQKKEEREDIIRIMNQLGRVLSCIVFPVFFFLLFFRVDIIGLLSDKYREAIPVFFVSLFVLPVRAYHYTTPLQKMHKGAIINAGAIGDLLIACALMYPLYRWLGLPGVALSFVISTYMQATYYLVCTARLLQTSPLKLVPYVNWIIKLIVFGSLFIGIRYAGNLYFTGKITLILGGVIMVTVVALSLLLEFIKDKKYGAR